MIHVAPGGQFQIETQLPDQVFIIGIDLVCGTKSIQFIQNLLSSTRHKAPICVKLTTKPCHMLKY